MKRIYKLTAPLAAWPALPFLFLFILALLLHINLPVIYDDVAPPAASLKQVYFNWSSRLIIYAAGAFFLKHKILWALADAAVLTAAAALISYLFADIKRRKYNFFACALVLVYPFYHMGSAGYISTTVVYLWSLTAALAALAPLKNNNTAPALRALYMAAALYAANLEQTAVILFIAYAVFIFRRKAYKSFPAAQAALVLASLVFILTCPGNWARLAAEAPRMHGFFEAAPTAALQTAAAAALGHFIYRPNFTFLLFSALLAAAAKTNKAAFAPLAAVLLFGFLGAAGVAVPLRGAPGSPAGLAVLFIAAACVCAGLFSAFAQRKKALLCIFILGLGLAGKLVLAASPTVLASSNRTYIFAHFAFLICSLMLFAELDKTRRPLKPFYALLCLCVGASLSMTCVYNYTKYLQQKNSAAYARARVLIEKIGIN
ncbi:MAG: DUF6056 family protein [Elusimicrobiota bacterium]|jgi:hypothetical protein|nr:DUF6056 family protein [Elusimicrobiota bacterium]